MNWHGSRLIVLCKTNNMFILNGRCGRDNGVGRYTRIDTTESSVIDYVLCMTKMHQRITEFQVGNKMPQSDHSLVTFSIKLNFPVENIAKSTHNWTPVYKYKFNQDGLDKLGHVINDNISKTFQAVFYASVSPTYSPSFSIWTTMKNLFSCYFFRNPIYWLLLDNSSIPVSY